MKKNILPLIAALVMFASCSTAYKTAQTPDDVYYSPGKTQEYAKVDKEDRQDRYNRRQDDEYEDYTSSSEDNYLRMKIQNRYQWNSLDNNDYWYSPNYAYNNYYGINSFNPYSLNSWGLNYYYSPFASIQPFSWFNNYYPSYGFGYGYTPYYGGYYGHNNGYGYYGYSPVNVVATSNRTHTSRPLLGGYTNNTYNNSNTRSRNYNGGRFAPADNRLNRYNNTNDNTSRYNNNASRSNNNNTNNNNSYTPPARSYTPSSSGSSGGGSVSRPVRH